MHCSFERLADVREQVKTQMMQQWKEAYPGLTGKLMELGASAMARSPEQGSFTSL